MTEQAGTGIEMLNFYIQNISVLLIYFCIQEITNTMFLYSPVPAFLQMKSQRIITDTEGGTCGKERYHY